MAQDAPAPVASPAAVRARLRVGMSFRGDDVPRNDAWIERFVLGGPGGEQPMAGWPAADPAGAARVEAPRLYWIAYHSRPSTVDLDADKVAAYAEEEGLDAFLGAGSAGEPRGIRDHFARCAKALVRIGDAAPSAEG